MSLSTYITERIKITSKTKSAALQPVTKDELRSIIEQELERQGPDADLNFIDTSEITDMSELFYDLNISNIKIDEWDVRNVENMEGMFVWCKGFNCDLSGWDVSNVVKHFSIFFNCDKIKDNMIPKFNK